jgi:hypothetical protein
MNRRHFFQITMASVAAVVGYSVLANAERRRSAAPAAGAAAGSGVLVDPNDSAAKGVSYVHVNTQIKDAKLQTVRTGVKFKDQRCDNCAFYTKEKEVTISRKKAGPCSMPFAVGKNVAAAGWCTSWAKKS